MKSIVDLRDYEPKPDQSLERVNFSFLDIETTGLRADRGAKITEVAILDRDSEIFYWKKEDLNATNDALIFHLPFIIKVLKKGVVVGHNITFDLSFISYMLEKYDYKGLEVLFIDTLSLAENILRKRSSYRLASLLKYFDISIHGSLHTARVDAMATRALFWKLLEHGDLYSLKDTGYKRIKWSSY